MFRVSVSSPLLGGFDEPETLRYKVNSDVPGALTSDRAKDKTTIQDRLAEEIDEAITNASDEEILKEAEEVGDDVAAFADRMRNWLAGKKAEVGRIAMEEAKAAAEKDRAARNENLSVKSAKPKIRPDSFLPDTVAARHGKKLSEIDRKGIEKDLDALFDDDASG